jgi:hypothetical protein
LRNSLRRYRRYSSNDKKSCGGRKSAHCERLFTGGSMRNCNDCLMLKGKQKRVNLQGGGGGWVNIFLFCSKSKRQGGDVFERFSLIFLFIIFWRLTQRELFVNRRYQTKFRNSWSTHLYGEVCRLLLLSGKKPYAAPDTTPSETACGC